MARLYDMGDQLSSGGRSSRGGEGRGRGAPITIPLRALLALLAAILAIWQTVPFLFEHTQPPSQLQETGRFHTCPNSFEENCVLNAGQFVQDDMIVTLSDISVPQVFAAACPAESQLAKRGALRLAALLNDGSFSMQADGPPSQLPDQKSNLVTRNGVSLGQALIKEGLARPWSAKPLNWCPETH